MRAHSDTMPPLGDRKTDPMHGLTALDTERAASMLDEGGHAAARVERDEIEVVYGDFEEIAFPAAPRRSGWRAWGLAAAVLAAAGAVAVGVARRR